MNNNMPYNYNDERFLKISEKLSQLHSLDNHKTINKASAIETRIDYLETSLHRNLKDYDYKFKFLQEEIRYLNKLIDENKDAKENLQNKINLELKNMETKIKTLFEKERINMKLSADNFFKILEDEIVSLQIHLTKEKNEIIELAQKIKFFVENDLPKESLKVHNCSSDRSSQIKNIIESMKEEFKYVNNLV